jgi:hypothetical protein
MNGEGTPGPPHPIARVERAEIGDVARTTAPPDHSLGDAIETFIRREDAERFIEEVRGDDPELESYLRIKERELEAGHAIGAGIVHPADAASTFVISG